MQSWWVSIATIIFGGVVAGLVTFAFNLRQAERMQRRQKLEELCQILRRLSRDYGSLAFRLEGGDTIDTREGDRPEERIRVLIALYFPSLSEKYEEAEATLGQMWPMYRDNGTGGEREVNAMVAVLRRGAKQIDTVFDLALLEAPRVNIPLWKIWK